MSAAFWTRLSERRDCFTMEEWQDFTRPCRSYWLSVCTRPGCSASWPSISLLGFCCQAIAWLWCSFFPLLFYPEVCQGPGIPPEWNESSNFILTLKVGLFSFLPFIFWKYLGPHLCLNIKGWALASMFLTSCQGGSPAHWSLRSSTQCNMGSLRS